MVKKFGAKQMCEIDCAKGRKVLVSYSTPVVVRDANRFYVTETWYSKTTTKHINHYLLTQGAEEVMRVDETVLRDLIAGTL